MTAKMLLEKIKQERSNVKDTIICSDLADWELTVLAIYMKILRYVQYQIEDAVSNPNQEIHVSEQELRLMFEEIKETAGYLESELSDRIETSSFMVKLGI